MTGTVDTQGNTLTLAGTISDASGNGILKKIGAGTLVLAGSNSYGGGTQLTAGTTTFSALNNLGTGAITFSGAATLQYAPSLGSPPDISSRAVTIGTGGGTINTNGNTVTYAAGIGNGGAGALNKAGNGTLNLGPNNTYTGGTNINGGNLSFASGGVPATGSIVIPAAGTLNIGGAFPTANSALTSGKITVASAAGAIGLVGDTAQAINMTAYANLLVGAGANTTYTGTIIPAGNIYRLGGGGATLTLPNANELTGIGNSLTIGTPSTAGTVVLTAANDFGGSFILTGSTVQFSALNNFGTGAAAVQQTLAQIALSGGTLQWAAGNTTDITTRNVFVFSGGATFDTNGNNLVFNNSFGGNGGTVTKAGLGDLTINSSTVHIGLTQISGGTLTLGNALALQSSTLNYATLGGTLGFGTLTSATLGGLQGNQNLDLTNASSNAVALTIGNNGAATAYSGNLTGAGSMTHVGNGTFTLSGHSTYAGPTILRQGTTTLAFGTTGGSNILPSGTPRSLAGASMSVTAGGATAATQTFGGLNLTERSSTISDTLTSAGANTSFGAITRSTGATVNLATVPAAAAGSFTTTTANSLFTGGQQTILGGYFVTGNNTWAVSGAGATPGAIAGLPTASYSTLFAAGLDVDAPASATPATMTINSLRFSGAGAHSVGNIGDGTTLTIANGGILNTSTSAGISLLDDSLTSGNGQDLIFWSLGSSGIAVASVVTGDIGVTLASGTVNLQNDNTYTGPTNINGGTLQFFENASLGNGGAVNFRGGALQYNGSTDDISARTIDIGFGGGTINTNGGNVNFANPIGNNGVGAFTKAGNGTLTLNGANSWQGTTTISGGTLELASGASVASKIFSVASGTTLTVDAGASLSGVDLTDNGIVNYNNATWSLTDLSGSGTLNLPNGTALTILNGQSTIQLAAQSPFSGAITGTGASLTVVNGVTSLNGTNTYTGDTNINGGLLVIGSANALNGGGAINFNGGVLRYSANTLDISSHTVNFASTAIIDTNSNNVTFAGAIGNSGVGGLSKIGLGTLTLNAANTYTGPTTAGGGKILLGVSMMNSSAVNAVSGTVELGAGGNKIIRTQTMSATAGGQINLQDNKAIVTAGGVGSWNGTNYDGITGLVKSGRNGGTWDGTGIVTSQAAAAPASGLTTIAVALNSSLPTPKTTFGGVNVASSDVLLMYTYAGDADLTGAITGDDYFLIDSGFTNHLTGYVNGDFNYDGKIDADDYFIIDRNYVRQGPAFSPGLPLADGASLQGVSAVPEPASLTMLAVAAAGIGARRRRK